MKDLNIDEKKITEVTKMAEEYLKLEIRNTNWDNYDCDTLADTLIEFIDKAVSIGELKGVSLAKKDFKD